MYLLIIMNIGKQKMFYIEFFIYSYCKTPIDRKKNNIS